MRQLIVTLLFVSFPISSIAFADSMRCKTEQGSELVSAGDSKFDVIAKCGPPDYSDVVAITRGTSYEKVEQLYYNCGEGKFIRILTFQGGILIKIKDGARGSGEEKCW